MTVKAVAIAYVIGLVIAIGMPLLVIRIPTVGTYRTGFFAATVAFGAIIMLPSAEMGIHLRWHPGVAPLLSILMAILYLTPLALLLEAGIFGYRGFSSWIRCGLLALAVLAGVALIASLLVPLVLRMR